MFWHVQETFQFYHGIGLEDREVSTHINVNCRELLYLPLVIYLCTCYSLMRDTC